MDRLFDVLGGAAKGIDGERVPIHWAYTIRAMLRLGSTGFRLQIGTGLSPELGDNPHLSQAPLLLLVAKSGDNRGSVSTILLSSDPVDVEGFVSQKAVWHHLYPLWQSGRLLTCPSQ